MKYDDGEKIYIRKFKGLRKQSVIINNFYSLLTIAIMSIVIIWYVNFILPQQKLNKEKYELKVKYLEYLKKQKQKRDAQIVLSQRLNKKQKDKNVTKK